jgi:hypothetical protein
MNMTPYKTRAAAACAATHIAAGQLRAELYAPHLRALHKAGYGCRRAAQKLNRMGVEPPQGAWWVHSTVHAMWKRLGLPTSSAARAA